MSEPKTVGEIVDNLPAPRSSAPITPMEMLGIAVDRGASVETLEKLVALQERVEARDAEREFIEAFARLSADLPHVKKNGTISLIAKDGTDKGSIAFAKWEDMDKVIRPLMAREGFTLSFDSAPRAGDGGGLVVTGTLMHKRGHTRSASMPLALDTGPGRNNLQAMGSTLSYGKRYCAEMLLNIVREGVDDDGKLGGAPNTISAEQKDALVALMKATRADTKRFLAYIKVATLDELPAARFEEASAALKRAAEAKAKKGIVP